MATENIIANGSVSFSLKRGINIITLSAEGTWSGGTLSLYHTIGGVDIAIKDLSGTAVTFTSDNETNITITATDDTESLKCTLSGSSSPDLNVNFGSIRFA